MSEDNRQNSNQVDRLLNRNQRKPEKAKELWDRFEFVYTPKHGSWLNMAEIELNVLIGQCLNRRMSDIDVMRSEVKAWEVARNGMKAKVNW